MKGVKELWFFMMEFYVVIVRKGRKVIDKQEESFFQWWEKIEPHKDQYNLRMAFDAGYKAGEESK